MPPRGLAILIGAGPSSGAGVARILAHPSHGNFAVALLARNPENLANTAKGIQASTPNPVIGFPSDTTPEKLSKAFADICSHGSFRDLTLRVAVYHVKHASKKPFLEETYQDFTDSLNTFVGGAMAFSQEVIKMLFAQQGHTSLAEGGFKKGTLIFTGTLGAMRTNANFAAYGGTRSAARSLAQALAKEYSPAGIQVVHTIVNGVVKNEESEATRSGKTISAEALGRNYLWLSEQEPSLWTHELDMRPAQEKF
ncbi:hypothetical protein MMC21_006328 [Puttea exsequens]|nr:hypothetical protein [Puttea exsequens]